MLTCTCPEWAPNIAKVDAPLATAIARNPLTAQQYDGVLFRYCPWCGKLLMDAAVTGSCETMTHHRHR